jgi:nicotinamidase-related amidase
MRDAVDRDYAVYVLADATADTEADVHELLTRKVFPTHAHVISIDELPGLLRSE